MSTYEALVNLWIRTGKDFETLCKESDDLSRINGMVLGLISEGVVDLGGPYLARVEMATRRIAASRKLGSDSLGEARDALGSAEVRRVQLDVARELGDTKLAHDIEAALAEDLDTAKNELENSFTLIEQMRVTLKELVPPRLVVG